MNATDQRPHILVVDDAPEILDLKDDILEPEGFRVSTLLRRHTGLPEIVAMCPDLLVMDYPAEEDPPLLHEAVTDARTRQIPVLLCTSAIREVEANRSELDALGIRVIFKPFDIDELIAVVRESMGLTAEPPESQSPPHE